MIEIIKYIQQFFISMGKIEYKQKLFSTSENCDVANYTNIEVEV